MVFFFIYVFVLIYERVCSCVIAYRRNRLRKLKATHIKNFGKKKEKEKKKIFRKKINK